MVTTLLHPRPPASSAWRPPVDDRAGPRDRTLAVGALVGLDVEQVHFMEAGVNLVLHAVGPRNVNPERFSPFARIGASLIKAW